VRGGERCSADSSWSTEERTYTMDFNRSRSCPAENNVGRLRAAPPPAQFLDVDEFKFDDFKFGSDDNVCLSGKFNLKDNEEADGKTVCSEPPKPSAAAYIRTKNNKKVPADASPTSVHECMGRISEDEEDAKYNLSLRQDYSVDKRNTSDITDVISNMEHGGGESPMAKGNNFGVSRNPNLVVMGSLEKHMKTSHDKQNQQQQQQQLPPKKSPPLFRRLFACGAPDVIHDFKANVKQKGVDTVEEVKGSFGDLGLTVRQVFSPVQNTKTVVKKRRGRHENTDDDDDATDEGDDESECGSSFAGSESECESEYNSTDDASEGSHCERVTDWRRKREM